MKLTALLRVILAALLTLSIAATCAAEEILVFSWETDIQSAVDAAGDGDALILFGFFEGTGNRNVSFGGKHLTLRGESEMNTWIDGGGDCASIFIIDGGQGSDMVIENLRIIGANYHAIICNNGSSPTLRTLILEENSGWCPDSPSGGGILCRNGSNPLIEDVQFLDNSSSSGGGLYVSNSSPIVQDCLFRGNAAGWGGAVYATGSASPVFTRCVFKDNRAHPSADPWYNYYGGYGGTIACDGGVVTLIDCEISGSGASEDPSGDEGGVGGAIFIEDGGTVVLSRVTIDGSSAANLGGGIYLEGASTLDMAESILAFTVQSGGIHTADAGCALNLSCSDVYGNGGGDYTGAIPDQTGIAGNISEDPLFCRASNPYNPLTLGEDSPCAAENNGCLLQMGAYGTGCDDQSHVHNVPGEYPTIQAALDAALSGDIVTVAPGVYFGAGNKNLDCLGKALILRGTGGSAETVIDCEHSGRGFWFHSNETNDCRVEGFTIRRGNGSNGGAIHCANADPYFSDLVIADCYGVDSGGAIACFTGADPVFDGLTIEVCSTPGPGGAVEVDGGSAPTFIDALMRDNMASGHGGAINVVGVSQLHLQGVTLVRNRSAMQGGGIYLQANSDATIERAIVAFNEGEGGLYVGVYSELLLTCSDFHENEGGNYTGYVADQTGLNGNISANPWFCDLGSSDFTLNELSPCLPANNSCGVLMGALGLGCVPVGLPEMAAGVPGFTLEQNYPNPFNPETTIRFHLPEAAAASLRIYDIAGRMVAWPLRSIEFEAGSSSLTWDGRDAAGLPLASGVYFYRLNAEGLTATRRMQLIK